MGNSTPFPSADMYVQKRSKYSKFSIISSELYAGYSYSAVLNPLIYNSLYNNYARILCLIW